MNTINLSVTSTNWRKFYQYQFGQRYNRRDGVIYGMSRRGVEKKKKKEFQTKRNFGDESLMATDQGNSIIRSNITIQ